MNNKMGCVYFFRHIGLGPVKIGYSSKKTPLKRFNQFKTYAPFGAEILGFIQSFEPKKLEEKLHLKFYNKRLEGEWFNISKHDVQKQIEFYSDKSYLEKMNSFYEDWCNFIDPVPYTDISKSKKKIARDTMFKNPGYDKNLLAEELGVSLQMIYKYLKK